MNYKLLFILLEGDDDVRFFERIIKPKFENKYDNVVLWKYAQQKNVKVDNFIKSIRSMGADYIYVADINDAPCITLKKEKIKDRHKNIDIDRVIVVISEIESWYLAGLDTESSGNLKISYSETTNNVTKEQFDTLIPKKCKSRIDFMIEIMKRFSIDIAKKKNNSFSYFLEKYDC